MNSKRLYIFLFLAAFTSMNALKSQVITVSEEIYLKNDFAYDVIGKMGENVLLFRERGNKFEIHAFDEELEFKWDREITFEKNKVDIIGVLGEKAETFSVFYGFRLKGDYYVRHKRFNSDITVIDTATIAIYENQYFAPKFLFSRSDDRTKAILFRSDRDSEIDIFGYDLVEKELLWEKSINFRNVYLRRDFRKMITTNDGDMHMVLERNKMIRKNNYFELYRIDVHSGDLLVKEVVIPELIAIDIEAKYDNLNHELVVAGMYAERNTSNAKGYYFFREDYSDRTLDMNFIEFSNELVVDVYGKEFNRNKGLADFYLKDMILRRDGGLVLISEMNKEFSRRANVPVRREYGRAGWVDYYYEDLIVFSIHPDGREHWNTVLHKRQYSQDDDAIYSSFFLFETPQSLRLLYNDEIKQENTVSEYVIKGNGKHERKSVFSTDYQRLRLRFKDAVQVAYNECIVPSERNNRLNLVRIRYD